MAHCADRLSHFVSTHGVREFKHSYRNLRALLKQGGASDEEVTRHLVQYWAVNPGSRHFLGSRYGEGSPFDHVELYGRDGKPTHLIGHPYQLDGDALELLADLHRLGLTVRVDSRSWYGYGTVQVSVYHYPTVAAFRESSAS